MPKQDLHFSQPITNLPGTLGYYPDFKRVPGLARLGAFFTNPISRNERFPAESRAAIHHAGTVLLHSGFPNPGIWQILKKQAPRWADSPLPVIPHLMVENIFEIQEMIEIIENVPGVSAISLSFSVGISDYDVHAWLEQVVCELPVILQVPPDRLVSLASSLQDTEVSALSMAPPCGSLPSTNHRMVSGRLFGRSLFPQTLLRLRQVKKTRLQILASGGIYSDEQVSVCLAAGATAVQLDTVLWTAGLSSMMDTLK